MRFLAAIRRWLEAQTLAAIAFDAAALVVALQPGSKWGDQLTATVKAMEAARGGVSDRAALERAAAGALARLGRLPNATR